MHITPTLFLLSCFAARAALAGQACTHPDANDVLEQSRASIHEETATYFPLPSARFLPFNFDGRPLQWMAASWEPAGGALFVLDCKGARLAALPVGKIQQMRPGPDIAGFGQTVEIIYVPGVATGDQWRGVKLVAFSAGSISVLWDHEASESAFAQPLHIDYTDTYAWRYSAGGTLIRVDGRRTVFEFGDVDHGWRPNTTHSLPRETFCWRPAQHIYAACKGR